MSDKKSKLRELYAYRSKLTEKLKSFTKQKDIIEKEIKDINERITGVNRGIDHIEDRQLLITTHFIERYRERVGVPDATEDQIRSHIVTPQLTNMISTLGNGAYPVDKYFVRVEDNKLITIVLHDKKENKPIYKQVKPRGIKRK